MTDFLKEIVSMSVDNKIYFINIININLDNKYIRQHIDKSMFFDVNKEEKYSVKNMMQILYN